MVLSSGIYPGLPKGRLLLVAAQRRFFLIALTRLCLLGIFAVDCT